MWALSELAIMVSIAWQKQFVFNVGVDSMEAFMNILYFLIAAGLILLAWVAYLFFNNCLDKMSSGWLQEALGVVLSFILLSSIILVLYFHAVSFSMGVVAISVIAGIVYVIRSVIREVMSL